MTLAIQNESKEQFHRELRILLPVIAKHANHYNNLVSSLQQTLRSDVTFHNIEATKIIVDDIKNASEALKKLQKSLKARAQLRMKEA